MYECCKDHKDKIWGKYVPCVCETIEAVTATINYGLYQRPNTLSLVHIILSDSICR